MTYYVTYAIDGRYTAEVEADSIEEAKKKAEEKYYDADFGDLECVDAYPVNCEDEDGNLTDY